MNRLEAQAYYENLSGLFSHFPRVALLNENHETLYLNYQTLSDIATLPQCAEISNKYLKLQDGDIVLTNDPYSGGTLLTSPTLIMGLSLRQNKNSNPADFIIAYRLTMMPRVGAYKTINDEGLRVPPSPFYIKGEVNTPIVEALSGHPQTPKDFTQKLTKAAEELLKLREHIKSLVAANKLDFSKSTVKEYLKSTEEAIDQKLEEIGEGTTSVEIELSASETIKLKAEHHDGQFIYDFAGTSVGENVFLTDTATIGAAIGATVSLLGQGIPVNSGIFSRFDIKAPRGTIVNSSFPRLSFIGHTDGLNMVAEAVGRALGQIHKKQLSATTGGSHCSYQLEFRDGKTFTDYLPTGTGARAGRAGLNAIQIWRRFQESRSIECWESQYPLQVLQSGFRPNSAGEGKFSGGMGVVRSLKILEEAQLTWAFINPPRKPEGAEGGKAALGAEIVIEKASGEKTDLPAQGQMKLSKGDKITILSPGGGAWGAKT